MKFSVSIGLLFNTILGYLYDSYLDPDFHYLGDDYIFGNRDYYRRSHHRNYFPFD